MKQELPPTRIRDLVSDAVLIEDKVASPLLERAVITGLSIATLGTDLSS